MEFTFPKPMERTVSNGRVDGKNSQRTVPNYYFTGRALTSTTRGKHTVNPAPQTPAIPKNTNHTEKAGKVEWPEEKTPPSNSFSCARTPSFRGGVEYDTSFPPNLLQTFHINPTPSKWQKTPCFWCWWNREHSTGQWELLILIVFCITGTGLSSLSTPELHSVPKLSTRYSTRESWGSMASAVLHAALAVIRHLLPSVSHLDLVVVK